MKKNIMLSYSAPKVEVFEVVAERGYQNSVETPGFGIPGFGTEDGEWEF